MPLTFRKNHILPSITNLRLAVGTWWLPTVSHSIVLVTVITKDFIDFTYILRPGIFQLEIFSCQTMASESALCLLLICELDASAALFDPPNDSRP
jgi:hypothetical protein